MTKESHSFRLDKWEICQAIVGGSGQCFVIGNVTGHPNHPEQARVHTSDIQELEQGVNAFIAHTRNSVYVLPYADAAEPFNPCKGGGR